MPYSNYLISSVTADCVHVEDKKLNYTEGTDNSANGSYRWQAFSAIFFIGYLFRGQIISFACHNESEGRLRPRHVSILNLN